eukprot:9884262-Alexandrium_andersonii.AAC.1
MAAQVGGRPTAQPRMELPEPAAVGSCPQLLPPALYDSRVAAKVSPELRRVLRHQPTEARTRQEDHIDVAFGDM